MKERESDDFPGTTLRTWNSPYTATRRTRTPGMRAAAGTTGRFYMPAGETRYPLRIGSQDNRYLHLAAIGYSERARLCMYTHGYTPRNGGRGRERETTLSRSDRARLLSTNI